MQDNRLGDPVDINQNAQKGISFGRDQECQEEAPAAPRSDPVESCILLVKHDRDDKPRPLGKQRQRVSLSGAGGPTPARCWKRFHDRYKQCQAKKDSH